MKKLWQRLLSYICPTREELLLRDKIIGALHLSLVSTHQAILDLNSNHARILCAIVLQHGGEFVLDHAFLELVTNNMSVPWTVNPDDKSITFTVAEKSGSPAQELPNGYDLPEDDIPCCPDNECQGGCSN